MGVIKDSFTFDDVTLVPQYSTVLPSEAITISKLSSNLNLQIPLMSAAMDTVTESKMAIAISKSGGIGVVHRNLSIEKQVIEVQKVKKSNCLVGAAIGVNPEDLERAEELSKIKTDLIVIDTAHGHTQKVLNMISKIKKKLKNCTLCAGNIATGKAAKFLADNGIDIVKVGIGPGSRYCNTRTASPTPHCSEAALHCRRDGTSTGGCPARGPRGRSRGVPVHHGTVPRTKSDLRQGCIYGRPSETRRALHHREGHPQETLQTLRIAEPCTGCLRGQSGA